MMFSACLSCCVKQRYMMVLKKISPLGIYLHYGFKKSKKHFCAKRNRNNDYDFYSFEKQIRTMSHL